MSFNWRHFVELGDIFRRIDKNNPHYQAYCRTCISRIYYGTFITLRNYLRDIKGIIIPKVNVHHFVINVKLMASKNPIEKRIGLELDRLKAKRNDADYEDICHINEREMSCVYGYSQKILYLHDELLKKLKIT